ncbi:MAG TPA: riboflavin synthase [Solirubrobacteraceae bacterium]|nr:riboflavin synthase [Solirubrobacteraceae bacterium]
MFTGLIADIGSVSGLEQDGEGGVTLRIGTRLAGEIGQGDSVAVDGVCLTANEVSDDGFGAFAMAETLRRSSLGGLEPGGKVNLELALRAGDRLGGHVVQGHVDGIGVVRELREEGGSRVLGIECDGAGAGRYLVQKGSIAVDGVSLTVSRLGGGAWGEGAEGEGGLGEDRFEVSLIPETLTRTNLGELAVGDRVNLEFDVLAKHVERLLEARFQEVPA